MAQRILDGRDKFSDTTIGPDAWSLQVFVQWSNDDRLSGCQVLLHLDRAAIAGERIINPPGQDVNIDMPKIVRQFSVGLWAEEMDIRSFHSEVIRPHSDEHPVPIWPET